MGPRARRAGRNDLNVVDQLKITSRLGCFGAAARGLGGVVRAATTGSGEDIQIGFTSMTGISNLSINYTASLPFDMSLSGNTTLTDVTLTNGILTTSQTFSGSTISNTYVSGGSIYLDGSISGTINTISDTITTSFTLPPVLGSLTGIFTGTITLNGTIDEQNEVTQAFNGTITYDGTFVTSNGISLGSTSAVFSGIPLTVTIYGTQTITGTITSGQIIT